VTLMCSNAQTVQGPARPEANPAWASRLLYSGYCQTLC